MDRTWIYRNIHLIISLLLMRTSEISSKEYYCTKAGTWREAMESCTESGGEPLSDRDVYNNTAFTLKDNRTIWTADFIYQEYVTDIAPGETTKGYECGYKTFVYKWRNFNYFNYFSRPDIQYGSCTTSKYYVCDSSTSVFIRRGPSAWAEAFSECSPHNTFALGVKLYLTFDTTVDNFEIWYRRPRLVTEGIVNGTITIDDNNIISCGQIVEEMKRYNNSNCEEHLESVCVFEDTVNDTDTFTRTCFEEETTEVPVNVTRMPFGGSTNVTSAENRTSKEDKDETTEVPVNVTKWPFAGSTIVTSADAYDSKTSNEHEGQARDYIALVVATIILSLTICCILIGIGLYCYWKQRRQNIDEQNATVRYVNENLSTTTTTGRNPSDTNGSVNNRANAVDIADENYEALGASSGINSADDIYTELNREYENVNRIGV